MSEQIEPGDGWRLLGPDEHVRAIADEYYGLTDADWHPVSPMDHLRRASDFHAIRRCIPAKPEAMEIDDGFRVELGNNLDHFAILQAGPPDSAGDVVIGNAVEARQLADWLNRFADWREAQE